MEIINKYFNNLTETQIEQLSALKSLYEYWNSKINVISRKSIENLYVNHILHSLSIAKIIQFKDNSRILDVGTGGGLPGIPLAILFPNVNFFLVDSIGKKIKVVNEISHAIGLTNTRMIHKRVEEVNETFDFVVSRAVTNMPKFKIWVKNKFSKININSLDNGILYLKGGDLSEELKNISHQQYNLSKYFEESYFKTKKLVYINN